MGRVLITGGAGFIGSHLVDELLTAGWEVRVLDNLLAQVHGGAETPPAYLSPEVEFIRADVRDQNVVRRALAELSDWLSGQIAIDRVDQATRELEKRGLTL